MTVQTVIPDLKAEVDVPSGGILSRTLYGDDLVTLTAFAFDAGQELREHTAARPVIVEVLDGTAEIGIGDEVHTLGAGGWVLLPARTPHSVVAVTPLRIALLAAGIGLGPVPESGSR